MRFEKKVDHILPKVREILVALYGVILKKLTVPDLKGF